MYTCLLDKFLATQRLQECHITTSMVKLYVLSLKLWLISQACDHLD